MAIYGYARVSSADQNFEGQVEALRRAGADVIRAETLSGTTVNGRDELKLLIEFLRRGDTLLVTRVDRLARSIADLQDIVRALKSKGASLKATEQPFDTGDIYGELTLNLLGVFAQFETQLRRERQLEGIARAKRKGVYTGGKKRINRAELTRLALPVDQGGLGLGATEVARRMGIGKASVYRLLAELGRSPAPHPTPNKSRETSLE
jgi:DNA invertase Pin-like site-specific DNA recombinase